MVDNYKIECFFLNVRKISELTDIVFSPDAYLSLAENSRDRIVELSEIRNLTQHMISETKPKTLTSALLDGSLRYGRKILTISGYSIAKACLMPLQECMTEEK
jgi:hypothetical protein